MKDLSDPEDSAGESTVLQNCLPGVTLASGVRYQSLEQEHHRSHPQESQFYYYQQQYQQEHRPQFGFPNKGNWPGPQAPSHLIVYKSTTEDHWLEEHLRAMEKQQRSSRKIFLSLLAVSLLLMVRWHGRTSVEYHSEVVTIVADDDVPYLSPMFDDEGDSDDDDDDDDKRQKAILQALERLDEEIEGDIILHSTKDRFQEAAIVWRQGLEPPLAVVEAASQEDVQLIVPILAGLARDYQLDFRIKSGGHSYGGYSTVKGGVVLSMCKLTNIEMLQNNQTNATTVVMEPGIRMEDFHMYTLEQHGHAGVAPDGARVGMGGFVLGGGFGLLSRKFGLAVDNLLRMKVVMTNGAVKDVAKGDDLFWAMRGAGGNNFGVVSELEYAVYPCDDMKLAATLSLPVDQATRFLQGLGAIESSLAGEVMVQLHGFQLSNDTSPSSSLATRFTHAEHVSLPSNHTSTTNITMYWMGRSNPNEQEGMSYLKQHVTPLLPRSAVDRLSFFYISWSAMSRAGEQPKNWSTIWGAKSWNGFLFAENNTKEVWEDIEENLSVVFRYCPHIAPKINLWGGAIATHATNATAFPHRGALYNIALELMVPNSTQNVAKVFEQESSLVDAVWPSIAKHLTGVYANYPMPDLSSNEYPTQYWGNNLPRLMDLKQRYDPFQVLMYEQSIPFPSNDSISSP